MGNCSSNTVHLDDANICTVCHGDHIYSNKKRHFCSDCDKFVAVIKKSALARLALSKDTTSNHQTAM